MRVQTGQAMLFVMLWTLDWTLCSGDSQEAQQTFMATLTQTLVDMTQNADGIQVCVWSSFSPCEFIIVMNNT